MMCMWLRGVWSLTKLPGGPELGLRAFWPSMQSDGALVRMTSGPFHAKFGLQKNRLQVCPVFGCNLGFMDQASVEAECS